MTTFTWRRGRSGESTGDSTDAVLVVPLVEWEMLEPTTLRALIVRYALDVLATSGKTGTVNTKSPVTVGVTYGYSPDGTFGNPPGPESDPGYGWLWWDGAILENAYGFATDVGSGGGLLATDKIIREAPLALDIDSGPFVKFWLVFEIEDVSSNWSTFLGVGWYQILTAPTVG